MSAATTVYAAAAVLTGAKMLAHHFSSRYTICTYCGKDGHVAKECLKFLRVKADTEKKDRFCTLSELPKKTEEGCAAAGLFLYSREDSKLILYVIKEYRPAWSRYFDAKTKEWAYSCNPRGGGNFYNFIGGKRNTASEWPMIIALREAEEEAGLCLPEKSRTECNAYWCAKSKYVLIQYRIEQPPKPTCCAEAEIVAVDFDKTIEAEWHPFAWAMLQAVKTNGLKKFAP